MHTFILGTDYPPLYVFALFLLAILCELAAVGLGLAGMTLCWFRTRAAQAHRLSFFALIAALAGIILTFVSHKLDLQPKLDRENLVAIGWFTGPSALVTLVAFVLTRYRASAAKRNCIKRVEP